ncbi:MAG: hypothetical protein NVSMB31_11590 [Vulcanimicrobiaceae bacterium]
MNLTWQTDSALRVTAVSPQFRQMLGIQPVAFMHAKQIAGPDGPADFGIIAHEWALQGERVTFETACNGVT